MAGAAWTRDPGKVCGPHSIFADCFMDFILAASFCTLCLCRVVMLLWQLAIVAGNIASLWLVIARAHYFLFNNVKTSCLAGRLQFQLVPTGVEAFLIFPRLFNRFLLLAEPHAPVVGRCGAGGACWRTREASCTISVLDLTLTECEASGI